MFTHPEQFIDSQMPQTSNSSLALKILLVEDNLTNQKVALRQLQTLGYQAHTVMNGQEAVEAITQACYDLILMDCQMPVMDGYEATRAIRAQENLLPEQDSRVVIIAMTASDLPQDQERAIEVGMDDFVSKPVRRDALAAVLQRWSQVILAAKTDGSQRKGLSAVSPPSGEIDCDQFQAHLDLQHLHLISDNSAEFELELLQIFTEDSLAYLQMLQQAIDNHNLLEIEQTAHHIKGSSANVGAVIMQSAAEKLERQAHQQKLVQTDELLAELTASLQLIQLFVEKNNPC